MSRSAASRLISAVSATALTLIAPATPVVQAQDLASGPSAADCAALGVQPRNLPVTYTPPQPIYVAPRPVPVISSGPVRFSIPREDAATGLAAWSGTTGIRIDAPAALTRGIVTAAVSGQMDPHDALNQMIAGTKLQILADDGYMISLGSAAADTVSAVGVTATGTNIAGVKPVGSPVQRLNREDILKSGASNLSQVLGSLPSIQAGAAAGGGRGGAPAIQPRQVPPPPLNIPPPPPAPVQAVPNPAPPVQNANVAVIGAPAANAGGQGARANLTVTDGQRIASAPPAQNANVGVIAISPPAPRAPPALRAPGIAGNPIIGGPGLAVLPNAPLGTESYPGAVTNPVKQVATDPVSTFSIDVDTASYSNVRRFLSDGQKPPTDAVRVEELVNYFDYNYPLPTSKDEPFKPFIAVAPSPFNTGRQIIHIGLQGYAVPAASRPPLNLVLLLDTSGSMQPDDRLPLAQKALGLLVDQLRPQDKVSIVSYAGFAGEVLSPTSGMDKTLIRCAINSLHAYGSTAGSAGLQLAYSLAEQNFHKDSVNRIVLITDGDFNVGTTDNKSLEDYVADKRKTGIYLSAYGVGRGNYQDTRMQTIAQNGNGTAGYLDSLSEARKLFRDDFSSSVFPIADDVKIQVEFNPARVSEYRLIGYETRLLNREDFNNDAVDAGEVGSGASVTALYEVTPVGAPGSVDPLRYTAPKPATASTTSELAYLKVRYKAPGGTESKLMQRPITDGDASASLAAAPEATRFAVAVAGFGEKLRGDSSLSPGFTWTADRDLALSARGDDPFGLRSEFVQLTRAAEERSVASR